MSAFFDLDHVYGYTVLKMYKDWKNFLTESSWSNILQSHYKFPYKYPHFLSCSRQESNYEARQALADVEVSHTCVAV